MGGLMGGGQIQKTEGSSAAHLLFPTVYMANYLNGGVGLSVLAHLSSLPNTIVHRQLQLGGFLPCLYCQSLTRAQNCQEEEIEEDKIWEAKVSWRIPEARVMLHPVKCLSNDFPPHTVLATATRDVGNSEQDTTYQLQWFTARQKHHDS